MVKITRVKGETEQIKGLAELLESSAKSAISENGIFKIGLSGGSIIKYLSAALPTIETDFSKWKFFFCDERVVPYDDPESTFGQYRELRSKLNLKEEQFVAIKPGLTAEATAKDYINQMTRYFPVGAWPDFDVLLLGIGPDGHTCSLFPGHKLLEEESVWVAPITDSPKPPPARITLTLKTVNNAKHCIFLIAGESKADIVKKILVDNEDLPATRVHKNARNVTWLLDEGAAKHL